MTTRTYLRRRGRISKGQTRALAEYGERFLISVSPGATQSPGWSSTFARSARLGLEIGFGMGHALVAWAQQHPDWNLLGIDVYQPGIGSVLMRLQNENLKHVRIINAEARTALGGLFSPASLDEVRIYFPDPWPKKRHHKRRLIQPGFATLLANRMKSGGQLLLASDWHPYAEWMLDVLDREPCFENLAGAGRFAGGNPDRPVTNFEARGQALGHEVWNLAFKRI